MKFNYFQYKLFGQELREEEFKTTLKEKEKSVENLQDSLKKLKREVEKVKKYVNLSFIYIF